MIKVEGEICHLSERGLILSARTFSGDDTIWYEVDGDGSAVNGHEYATVYGTVTDIGEDGTVRLKASQIFTNTAEAASRRVVKIVATHFFTMKSRRFDSYLDCAQFLGTSVVKVLRAVHSKAFLQLGATDLWTVHAEVSYL